MKKAVMILLIGVNRLEAAETVCFLNSNSDPEQQSVIRYLMDAFELENPDINVNLVFYNENDEPAEILQYGRGIEPDLIMADSRLLLRLSQIKDMDYEFIRQLLETRQGDMYAGALQAFQGIRGPYGIPFSAWLQVLWYRIDWFEESGLSEPKTIKNIITAAETLHNPEENRYGLIIGKDRDSYLEQCFLQISAAEGLKLNRDKESYTMGRTELTAALQLYKTLSRFTPPGKVNWRFRDFFLQEKTGMLFYSTFLMDDLALPDVMADSLTGRNFPELEGSDYNPNLLENTGMITTIVGSEESSFGSISGIGIFEGTDESKKKAIEELIEFLYRPDVYISWLHMSPGGMLPVNRSIPMDDNFYRDNQGVFRRYDRNRFISMIEGLEHLVILNPQELLFTPENGYRDREFVDIIYNDIHSTGGAEEALSSCKWLQ